MEPMATRRRMHQTTVRFSPELWAMLEDEAARGGISVAHFVRDAALARVAYTAGQRSAQAPEESFEWADPGFTKAGIAKSAGQRQVDASAAVQAQARLAAARATELRDRAKVTRGRRLER
jgi:hypothetical protein